MNYGLTYEEKLLTGYKGVFTPSNFLSVVKRTGNRSILFQNEEVLVNKSSVSFVC